jgi:hypothetical protein
LAFEPSNSTRWSWFPSNHDTFTPNLSSTYAFQFHARFLQLPITSLSNSCFFSAAAI